MTVKVSVIIATYASGRPLDDVIAALDKQSLPISEYEVVLIDDGSPDNTFERLQGYAATRPHFVVDRIENSGWPGKPRNVGIGKADGEYVFFLDHDDHIFPEALERMYEFAAANDLDMVIPKEVVKGWNTPGWNAWREQIPRLTDLPQHILQCITPHKLYRRAFLLERGVKFPEGRIRLEDFSFNAQVYVRSDKIGVLADYPCSTWIIHETNSHKGAYDFEVYWNSFEDSLQPIVHELEPSPRQYQLLVRWYRSRILERLRENIRGWSEEYSKSLFDKFAYFIDRYFPPEMDSYLNPTDRARSSLLRAGNIEGLRELADLDTGLRLTCQRLHLDWIDGALRLQIRGTVTDSSGQPVLFDVAADTISRRLPDGLTAALGGPMDLRADLETSIVEIVIRHRQSAVDWILPATSSVTVGPDLSGHSLQFSADAVLDPASAAFGQPLEDGLWDIFYRLEGPGLTSTTRLPAADPRHRPALINGRSAIAYPTVAGKLALDLGARLHSVPRSADPRPEDFVIDQVDRSVTLRLPRVHVFGETELPGKLRLGDLTLPGTLTGRDGLASVTGSLDLPPGEVPVGADFGGKDSSPILTVRPEEKPPPPADTDKNLLAAITRRAVARPLFARRNHRRTD